jgi:hypothetical protein
MAPKPTFNEIEISVISMLLCGFKEIKPGSSLNYGFWLEDDRLEHTIGDRLEVKPLGFVVTWSGSDEEFYFSRTLIGLIQAVEKVFYWQR